MNLFVARAKEVNFVIFQLVVLGSRLGYQDRAPYHPPNEGEKKPKQESISHLVLVFWNMYENETNWVLTQSLSATPLR